MALRQIWESNFIAPYMASKSLMSELFPLGGQRRGRRGIVNVVHCWSWIFDKTESCHLSYLFAADSYWVKHAKGNLHWRSAWVEIWQSIA